MSSFLLLLTKINQAYIFSLLLAFYHTFHFYHVQYILIKKNASLHKHFIVKFLLRLYYNCKIEEKNTVVQEYLEHEKTTYENIKPENVIAALSMFLELNFSDLAKKEIEIYKINQNKLINLKEEQITGIPTARFLLYFGN